MLAVGDEVHRLMAGFFDNDTEARHNHRSAHDMDLLDQADCPALPFERLVGFYGLNVKECINCTDEPLHGLKAASE